MDKNKENIEIDLKRILWALWSRAWIVILAGIVCAAAAFSYAYFLITPSYASSVTIYVNNTYVDNTQGFSSSQLTAAQDLADTYMVILKSRSVLDKVAEQTNLGYSGKTLEKMIEAHAINETEVFEVEVTCTNYKHAAVIANAIADVLPGRIAEVVEGSSVKVVDYAEENPTPVGPSYKKFVVLGAAVGILLSAVAVILMDVTDTTIVSEEYLSNVYPKTPLLAVISGPGNGKSGYRKGYYRGYYRGYYQTTRKKEETADKPETSAEEESQKSGGEQK